MQKFFQSTLGMVTLFALGALAVYVIAAGFQGTWNPFMASTDTTPASTDQTTRVSSASNQVLRDAKGNIIGRTDVSNREPCPPEWLVEITSGPNKGLYYCIGLKGYP